MGLSSECKECREFLPAASLAPIISGVSGHATRTSEPQASLKAQGKPPLKQKKNQTLHPLKIPMRHDSNRNQTTLMTCTGVHIVLVEINPEVWIGGLFSQTPCTVIARRLRFWQLPQCIFWGVAVIPSPIPSVSHIMPACILYSSIYPHLPLWQCCDLGRKPRWSLFLLELLWSSLRRAHPRCPPMMNALTAREFWRWSCTAALRFNDTLISRTALKRCCLHLFIFVSRHGLLQLSVLA